MRERCFEAAWMGLRRNGEAVMIEKLIVTSNKVFTDSSQFTPAVVGLITGYYVGDTRDMSTTGTKVPEPRLKKSVFHLYRGPWKLYNIPFEFYWPLLVLELYYRDPLQRWLTVNRVGLFAKVFGTISVFVSHSLSRPGC